MYVYFFIHATIIWWIKMYIKLHFTWRKSATVSLYEYCQQAKFTGLFIRAKIVVGDVPYTWKFGQNWRR